jgi:hypothetical protein
MKQNIGGYDKIFRIILGVVIILLGIFLQNWWGVVGVIPLLTGLTNRCPLYLPLGISTCKIEKK